jgi:type 2 lantibiotic biosynthesis protein LanM
LGLRANCQGFQLQSLSNNLYDGSPGVALFLAALAKVTSNSDWRDLALRTLQPLRHQLRDFNPEVVKKLQRLGIGGTTGLGSIVYALVQISHFISDADLIEDGKKVADLITPELISADHTFALMDGTAGAILACLKLYEVERSVLEQAIACGEHLLENQIRIGDQLKTGFSQGAAGIAYALLRLFEVTQDARFLEGAKKAIVYEQSYFSTSAQNWRDLRSEELIFRNSWTNGAAGIGLGRLGSLSILDNEAITQEITCAVTTTQKHCLEDVDNLAWGNLGRIETLLVASQILNRPDLLDFGLQATTHLVQQAQLRGRFNLCSASVPVTYNPGFFQGTTGIGYQLLRIAYPHLLPSILLWE